MRYVVLSFVLFSSALTCAGNRRYADVIPQKGQMLPFIPGQENPLSHLMVWEGNIASQRIINRDEHDMIVGEASYHFLPNAFRFTPQSEGKKSKHLIMSGCSFTFGLHVNDAETTAARLASVLPDWHVLNIGREGSGPAEPYFLFSHHDVTKTGIPEEGVMIYQLIGFQQERILPSWRVLGWLYNGAPIYDYEDGKLSLRGPAIELWSKRWANTVRSLELEYWWLRLTSKYDDATVKAAKGKLIALLQGVKEAYLKQFPKGRFIIHPFLDAPTNDFMPSDEFLSELERRGFEVRRSSYTWPAEGTRIPVDLHPNPTGHLLQAKLILKNLEGIFGKVPEPKAAR